VGRKIAAHVWRGLFFFLWAMIGVAALVLPFLIALLTNPNTMAASAAAAILFLIAICVGFVPFIVKMLSYSAMPYIVRECPKVPVRKALRLSITLMKGNKRKLFVLILSFFGWYVALFAIAFAVVQIFFAGSDEAALRRGWSVGMYIISIGAALHPWPYMAITRAGFYHSIKRDTKT